MTAGQPAAPGRDSVSRTITIEADITALEKMRKEGRVDGFTVYCDEGPRLGGDDTAPSPMRYYCQSVGF